MTPRLAAAAAAKAATLPPLRPEGARRLAAILTDPADIDRAGTEAEAAMEKRMSPATAARVAVLLGPELNEHEGGTDAA